MKALLSLLAAVSVCGFAVPASAALPFFPPNSIVQPFPGQRQIVSYLANGMPVYAVYQIVGYDAMGYPIYQWVTQPVSSVYVRPYYRSYGYRNYGYHNYGYRGYNYRPSYVRPSFGGHVGSLGHVGSFGHSSGPVFHGGGHMSHGGGGHVSHGGGGHVSHGGGGHMSHGGGGHHR